MISFLRSLFPTKRRLPEGWTDDLSVFLPDGETAESLAQMGVAHLRGDGAFDELRQALCDKGLSESDAELAADRIAGGMTRALLPNPANAPDAEKDPIGHAAWTIARNAHR